MKTSTKFIALMALLAAGTASAQSAPTGPSVSTTKGTNEGTKITNVAQATFDDPTDANKQVSTVSNHVTTTVQAKAAFNITYADGSQDDENTNVPGKAPSTYQTSAVPGQVAAFKYTAVNNGNSTQTITLVAPTTANGGLTGSITAVKYYSSAPTDTNSDGRITSADLTDPTNTAREISSLTVAPEGDDPTTAAVETHSGMQDFYLVYVTPSGTAGDVVGATPIGKGQVWNSASNTNPEVQETASVLFYQYSKVTVQGASGVVGPWNFPDGNASATTYVSGTTSINELNDIQTAAPAKATTSVTFTNTLKNTGGQTDSFQLLTTDANGTTVTFLTTTGATFSAAGETATITPAGGTAYTVTYKLVNGVPTIIGLKPGHSASYQTKVDYTNTPSAAYNVTVGVDSVNDLDTAADDRTTNVVNVPGASFGNSDNNKTTDPTDTAATASGLPGATFTFPLEIKNTGGSADTYYVTSSPLIFTVVNASGVQSTVTVTPTYAQDTDCDGTADTPLSAISATSPITVSGGATACVVMSVTLPAGATVQTVSFNETLQATLGGSTPLTVSDTITVALTNSTVPGDNTKGQGLSIVKTPPTTTTAFVPSATLVYGITAKNTYNAPIKNFYLTEKDGTLNGTSESNIFAITYFKSVTGTVSTPALSGNSKVMYRYNGGNWTTSTTPDDGAGNLPSGVVALSGDYDGSYSGVTQVDIAIDVDNNDQITSADYLASQQQLNVTFQTVIK